MFKVQRSMFKVQSLIIAFCVVVVVFVLGYVDGCTHERSRHIADPSLLPETTTVTIYDTIPYRVPVPVDSAVIRYEVIPLFSGVAPDVLFSDSTPSCGAGGDTTFITLPITQKVYSDSAYTAYVSGYRPSLDSIFVYPRTTLATVLQPVPVNLSPKRWGIGLQLGVGMGSSFAKPSPYIGIGISYNLITF